ncbi:DNA-binding GntR family transcriptional regulator [Microbacterium phyllosphaerae]|uniref:DNA-binding GntR family transcriptional regulator n=1 Tax=Microbacterium phyllosphaerae TaxID=124798 RepID=A0ABS4WL40_9MICO|nr:GntR family transcriptional regulator [Microbacterium phyllosphaerae]MBP2376912.1 DNA-binding GntR family transcriptional regulator [Microbacterium phyllosphaerae]
MPFENSQPAVMPRRFLRDHIYRELRNAIISGQLVPGEKLRVDEIVEQFGGSRFPARDALSRLAADGLVIVRPQSGSVVAPLDVRECDRSLTVLQALFAAVVRGAVPLLDEGDRHALSTFRVSAFRDDADPVVAEEAAADLFDVFFHRFGNDVMTAARDELLPVVIRTYRALSSELADEVSALRAVLRQLIDRANAGDSDGAAQAMSDYFEGLRDAMTNASSTALEASMTHQFEEERS